jgi:hypothetical protein
MSTDNSSKRGGDAHDPAWLRALRELFAFLFKMKPSACRSFSGLIAVLGVSVMVPGFRQWLAERLLGIAAGPADPTNERLTTLLGFAIVALGMALFYACYRAEAQNSEPPPTAGIHDIAIPAGATFEDFAMVVGGLFQRNVILDGFSPEQRRAKLKPISIGAATARELLGELRHLGDGSDLPSFEIIEEGQRIILRAEAP